MECKVSNWLPSGETHNFFTSNLRYYCRNNYVCTSHLPMFRLLIIYSIQFCRLTYYSKPQNNQGFPLSQNMIGLFVTQSHKYRINLAMEVLASKKRTLHIMSGWILQRPRFYSYWIHVVDLGLSNFNLTNRLQMLIKYFGEVQY